MCPIRKTSLTPNVIKGHMLNLNQRPKARVSDHGQQAGQAPSIISSNTRMEANNAYSRMYKVTPLKRGTTL